MRTAHLHAELALGRSPEAVFPFFADPRNLEAITPPWLHFEVLDSSTPEIREGTLIRYRLRLHGVPLRWCSRISLWEPPWRFVDEQVEGPYRLWRHQHTFEPRNGGTLASDWVEYAALGGTLVRRLLIEPDLKRIFDYRSEALRRIFAEQAPTAASPARRTG
jgi:hypothetical protein